MPDPQQPQPQQPQHQPLWEKVLTAVIAVIIVFFAMFLIVYDKPFTNPIAAVAFRFLLALALGILGALIPGFMHANWKGGGLVVRAGSGLAVFLFALVYTPQVFTQLTVTHQYLQRLESGKVQAAFSELNHRFPPRHRWSLDEAKAETQAWINEDRAHEEVVVGVLRFVSEMHDCIDQGLCNERQLCAKSYNEIENILVVFNWYLELVTDSYRNYVQAAKLFRTCDCYEFARENYCVAGVKMTEWCRYPDICPFSLTAKVRDAWRLASGA